MIVILIFLAWWVSGIITMLFLGGLEDLTWGGLLASLIAGLFGPLLLGIILLILIIDAEFWNKPIFRRKKNG